MVQPSVGILFDVLVGIAPVLCFLAALVVLDSYKLVSLRLVVAVVVAGLVVAGFCYLANGFVLSVTGIEFEQYTRYVGPLVEELAKALVVVALIRMHRIGFLVDAAILGFATGTGFAIVENLWYQHLVPDAGLGLWIVRGFGTALMHGGTTALFAIMGVAFLERAPRTKVALFVPGFLLAVVLHSAFNHIVGWPRVSALAALIVLPPLLFAVFQRSERALSDWLGTGFDADALMLESINSGRFADSPAGRYLASLKDRFEGPILADLLCCIRLHTELALRAKGVLMMRESGFEVPVDEETRAKFTEMRYLEKSVGPTGMLAVRPLLHTSHKDLWQLYMLGA
jgi:RsiW-degrading membrane proteinase PrsW (M82 family)